MKKQKHLIFLTVSLILALALTACGDKTVSADIDTDLGKFIEADEDTSKLIFEIDGHKSELLTKDTKLVDTLQSEDDYILAYDKDKNIISIKPVDIKTEKTPNKKENNEIIKLGEKVDLDGFNLVDKYEFDDKKISLYTSAEEDNNGEFMFDDGQNWKLIVHDKDGDYELFNDYVQLGQPSFDLAQLDEDLYIFLNLKQSANIEVKKFKFDDKNKNFILIDSLGLDGNVNLLHSSDSIF